MAAAGLYSHTLGRDAMRMQGRGDASVAGAGLYSHRLDRVAMTMPERADASVAGAGLYSHRLGRVAKTMQETWSPAANRAASWGGTCPSTSGVADLS